MTCKILVKDKGTGIGQQAKMKQRLYPQDEAVGILPWMASKLWVTFSALTLFVRLQEGADGGVVDKQDANV